MSKLIIILLAVIGFVVWVFFNRNNTPEPVDTQPDTTVPDSTGITATPQAVIVNSTSQNISLTLSNALECQTSIPVQYWMTDRNGTVVRGGTDVTILAGEKSGNTVIIHEEGDMWGGFSPISQKFVCGNKEYIIKSNP